MHAPPRLASWLLASVAAVATPATSAPSLEALDRVWLPSVIVPPDTTGGSDVWGYVAPDGTDYAIMGFLDGIAVYEVMEDGSGAWLREVDRVDGPTEYDYWYHRDIKTLGHYAYVVAEMPIPGGGLQIIDLSGLPGSVELVDTYVWGSQVTSHNLSIDTARGYAYVLRSAYDGFRILDLGDPEQPVELPWVRTDGIHDVYARNDTVWVAEGWSGSWSMWDVTDKSDPTLLARELSPDRGYVHNAWPTDDGRYLLTTEEIPYVTVKIWDLSDPGNIRVVGEYLGDSDLAHNVHVQGNLAVISHYAAGVTLVDISDPTDPVEVDAFDTHPVSNEPYYRGCWGAFPFTDGGYVYASDIEGYLTLLSLDRGGLVPPPIAAPGPGFARTRPRAGGPGRAIAPSPTVPAGPPPRRSPSPGPRPPG